MSTGGGSIRQQLANLDLRMILDYSLVEWKELEEEEPTGNEWEDRKVGRRKDFLLRRMELAKHFIRTNIEPKWMVLCLLLVLPPELRPIYHIDEDKLVTSDINEIYRRIIYRNNTLTDLLTTSIATPEELIISQEKLLQEAVDALLDNGICGQPMRDDHNRIYKSLSDVIEGKEGRVRETLLGKRVDYSGRSVIVVGPSLSLHRCGLPREIAIELFQAFVIRDLIRKHLASNIGVAKSQIRKKKPIVWEILQEILDDHPVLLNRAPTLHRLGIQAFLPLLVEGRAICLHPLVCKGFNADFDGDQMAVHVPLSLEAQAEARLLMFSHMNLLSSTIGDPISAPTQDMLSGLYVLTSGNRRAQRNMEVLMAERPTQVFHNKVIDGTAMKRLISRFIDHYGIGYTSHILDQVKTLGFRQATAASISLGIDDLLTIPSKRWLVQDAEQQSFILEKHHHYGNVHAVEKLRQSIEIWYATSEYLRQEMTPNFRMTDPFNPVHIMSFREPEEMHLRSTSWICQLCYGRSPAHDDLVELGEAVGGTAEHVRAPSNGKIKFNEDLVHPTRTRHEHPAFLCSRDLYVTIESEDILHNEYIYVLAHDHGLNGSILLENAAPKNRLYIGWFGVLMIPTLLTATSIFIIAFIAAPPVDIDGIREPVSGSLLYGNNIISGAIIPTSAAIGLHFYQYGIAASVDEWLYNGGPYELIVLHFLLGVACYMGREWELSFVWVCDLALLLHISSCCSCDAVFLIYQLVKEAFLMKNESANEGYRFGQEEETYNIVAAHGIWFTALGISTMAFNLNGFNFNQSVVDSQGRVINTWADIINRANLGMEVMHERNAHNFL
ncbi:hypothetical protein E3N88_46147 [Mikania micrantha]|uniref:DNA-directed RNA polymerase subunit n=1 Tax=Mikania micrantha TaxID=192012 RepID=A0A5N6L9H8_9ASTR|nr:hypothetical protein E3N88_46147 [Mikania micrantha]